MTWTRDFAKAFEASHGLLAIVRAWLAQIWVLAINPVGLKRLHKNKAMQNDLRWMLRLTEAVLRLAITQRASQVNPPQTQAPGNEGARHRRPGNLRPGLIVPKTFVARFRVHAAQSRWAECPPSELPSIRKPQSPAALLNRVLALRDGLDRFEELAWREAKHRARQKPILPDQVVLHELLMGARKRDMASPLSRPPPREAMTQAGRRDRKANARKPAAGPG